MIDKNITHILFTLFFVTACAPSASDAVQEDETSGPRPLDEWTSSGSPFNDDLEFQSRIQSIVEAMTIEEKVGQVIQADISHVTPEDVKRYNLGSVLAGGNSAPNNDVRGAPQSWLELADEFWTASSDRSDDGVGIPILWGTDAVHGHSNIVGATIFPHNIGLGASRNAGLVEEIGRVTAKEVRVTGLDWTFAPTLAVARNDRWGRTFESFSEEPSVVKELGGAYIRGVQGQANTDTFLDSSHILGSAKHFVGDGGTRGGVDQGDTRVSEEELRDIHGAGYPTAIEEGVQTIMASYNAFHGRKLHGHQRLLTTVLRDQLGFDGFVIGDWNGHGQVAGCTDVSCAAAFNAGIDMFMAPDSWRELYENLLKQVNRGDISMARLDEAVTRILTVKMRAGLFEAGLPSSRKLAGDWAVFADPEHKAVARQAVRESLVLLKNDDNVLPISPKKRVLIAGVGADNIGLQSGGWTLSWQGTGNANHHFPNGQSIYDGVRDIVERSGGVAILDETGASQEKPDVAIIVFGEEPYAEYEGDRRNVSLRSKKTLAMMRKFKSQGVKVVAVLLSGRPLHVKKEIDAADAFVAAWLPGDQGAGVADVLFTDEEGAIRHNFSGRLPFSWPRTAHQTALNVGDEKYDPLFPFGYGLRYRNSEQASADGAKLARH